jgi:hypothetical protein
MSGPVIIKYWCETVSGCDEGKAEVPRAEWDALTPAEREAYAVDTATTHQNNVAPCGYEVFE